MLGIYLGACKAYHSNYDIVYQDIDGYSQGGSNVHVVIEKWLSEFA